MSRRRRANKGKMSTGFITSFWKNHPKQYKKHFRQYEIPNIIPTLNMERERPWSKETSRRRIRRAQDKRDMRSARRMLIDYRGFK